MLNAVVNRPSVSSDARSTRTIDEAGLSSVTGSLDEIGGAVVDAEVVGSIHARGRVEGDGDRRVLEPNERAAATTAHEGDANGIVLGGVDVGQRHSGERARSREGAGALEEVATRRQ